MTETLEQRVRLPEDQRAIQEVIYDFSWGGDRGQRKVYLDVFGKWRIAHRIGHVDSFKPPAP